MNKYRVAVEYQGPNGSQSRDFVVEADTYDEAKEKVESSMRVWYVEQVEFKYGKRLTEKSLGTKMYV